MQVYNLGIVGVGGFGEFLIDSYSKLKDVNVYAITSRDEKKLNKICSKYKIEKGYSTYRELLQDKKVDIVLIATPPFLHYEEVIEAAKSKKHILCEKPLAINLKQGKKIKKALNKYNVNLTMDFILRKNPLIMDLKKFIDKGIFGKTQNFIFQNFAGDGKLVKDHWFWDRKKSGGIWIEHGVHFFDLFNHLLTSKVKKVISTANGKNEDREDQLMGICKYENGVMGSFLHSFSKPNEIERTESLISFDRGYVKIKGWIPESLEIEGYVSDKELKIVKKLFKGAKIKTTKTKEKILNVRESEYKIDKKINIEYKLKKPKQEIYQDSARMIMEDFIKKIKNPSSGLDIDVENGYESLRTAVLFENNKFIKKV
jgi:predicted dehydrogenase